MRWDLARHGAASRERSDEKCVSAWALRSGAKALPFRCADAIARRTGQLSAGKRCRFVQDARSEKHHGPAAKLSGIDERSRDTNARASQDATGFDVGIRRARRRGHERRRAREKDARARRARHRDCVTLRRLHRVPRADARETRDDPGGIRGFVGDGGLYGRGAFDDVCGACVEGG